MADNIKPMNFDKNSKTTEGFKKLIEDLRDKKMSKNEAILNMNSVETMPYRYDTDIKIPSDDEIRSRDETMIPVDMETIKEAMLGAPFKIDTLEAFDKYIVQYIVANMDPDTTEKVEANFNCPFLMYNDILGIKDLDLFCDLDMNDDDIITIHEGSFNGVTVDIDLQFVENYCDVVTLYIVDKNSPYGERCIKEYRAEYTVREVLGYK